MPGVTRRAPRRSRRRSGKAWTAPLPKINGLALEGWSGRGRSCAGGRLRAGTHPTLTEIAWKQRAASRASVLDTFRLDGRRALVTGGNRGLGGSWREALAEAEPTWRWPVIASGMPDRAEEIAADRAEGPGLLGRPHHGATVGRLVTEVEAGLGPTTPGEQRGRERARPAEGADRSRLGSCSTRTTKARFSGPGGRPAIAGGASDGSSTWARSSASSAWPAGPCVVKAGSSTSHGCSPRMGDPGVFRQRDLSGRSPPT
jgi:hypothetical protein